MTTDLNALRQSAEKILGLRENATKGPWSNLRYDNTPDMCFFGTHIIGDCSMGFQSPEERTANAALIASVHQACDTLAAMLPLIDDAARYRWLRHGDNDEAVLRSLSEPDNAEWKSDMFLLRDEKLDAAIDAAMKHTEPDGEKGEV